MGGKEHVPIHHTNEIAQSECANGEKYVNYWLHYNFLNDTSGKMSKSNDDFLRLQTLIDEGISPLAYRYYLLLAHFRSEIQFSFESLRAAETAYKKLYALASEWNTLYEKSEEAPDRNTMLAYYEALYDDIGTPQGIAVLWNMLKSDTLPDETKYVTLLAIDQTLGLNLRNAKKVAFTIPEELQNLLDERATARVEKNFTKSDELRESIEKLGFKVIDSEGKQEIELL